MTGLARTKLPPDEREVRWVMGPSRSCCRPLSRSGAREGGIPVRVGTARAFDPRDLRPMTIRLASTPWRQSGSIGAGRPRPLLAA